MRENYKEAPQKKLMDEQIKKFKTLAENMQKRHNDMMEDMKKKNQYIILKDQENQALQDELKQYKEVLQDTKMSNELQQELDDTKVQIEDLEYQLEEAETKLKQSDDLHKQAMMHIQTEMVNKDKEISQMKQQIQKEANDQNESNQKQIDDLKASNDKLQKDIDKLNAQLGIERENFKSQIETIAAHSDKSAELKSLENKLKEEQKKVKTETAKAESYNKLIDKLHKEVILHYELAFEIKLITKYLLIIDRKARKTTRKCKRQRER